MKPVKNEGSYGKKESKQEQYNEALKILDDIVRQYSGKPLSELSEDQRALFEMGKTREAEKTYDFDFSKWNKIEVRDSRNSMYDYLLNRDERDIDNYIKYLQIPSATKGNKGHKIKALLEYLKAHPEYYIYVFDEKKILEALFSIFEGNLSAFNMNKGLTPSQIDAIEIAVMLGFADIKGEGKTCVIMRADDAQSLVSGIEKTDYAAVLKKLEMFDKCITALVMLYGIIEIDEAVDRIKEEMVIDGGIAGIKRMLYWHSRMMNIVETSSNLQSHVAYVQIPGLNGNRIIEYRNREKIDSVLGYKPYKRGFLKTYDGNIAEMYECWADMHGLLTYVYGMDDDIAGEFCIDLFYMVSDRAASADDLYNSILEKCGADSPFTKAAVYECCLACVNDTDIPQLMGHSREDYYKKTGRWPGGLLFGNGKRKKIERDTPPGFLPETDQHKMLFISTSEAIENNREKALKVIDELTEKYSDNLVVLAIAVDPYVAVGHREKAKRVLQTLRLMDHSLGKEIKYITERIDLKKNRDADEKVPDSQFMPSGTIWDMEDNLYTPQPQIERQHPKVGRNDPCPCGSGKKFKKCCQGKGIYD